MAEKRALSCSQEKGLRWGEDRYYTLAHYLKETFGRRLYKLALDGGMSCPNRDGTLDTCGCIFCSRGGSGDYASDRNLPIAEQIETAKALIAHKVSSSSAPSYIAYFQAYTNTYPPKGSDSISWLKERFLPAIRHPEVAVLSIATRPDCLSEEICDLLAELNQQKPVWVELGLQTAQESTAHWLRRGYDNAVFEQALRRLEKRSLDIIVHLILGLKGETLSDMTASVHYINQFPIQGVKFQLLHVLSGTDLSLEWDKLHILSEEEYIDCLLSCLAALSPSTIVHRITGDAPRSLLLAPHWSLHKKQVFNHIRQALKTQDIWQGKCFTRPT